MKTNMSDPQVLAGFEAELDRNKVAFVGAAGRALLSGGLGLARKAGMGNAAKSLITKGTRAAGGGKNLSRLVGTGAVAGGAGLAAGGLAGRASRR